MAASAGHLLLDLVVVLAGAKLGGEAAERIRQPAVLGELLAGILLSHALLGGAIGLPDLADGAASGAEALSEAAVLGAFASLGAILLLFQVGIESRVSELRKVGASSLLVALIGIVVSFAVGYGASWALATQWDAWRAADAALPPYLLHVFVGATLTATSVGITARVLSDLGRLGSPEARVILGAAVLDDIGGLVVLAVVAAMVEAAQSGGTVDALALLRILGAAFGFLLVAVGLGRRFVPRAYDWLADRAKVPGVPVALAVAFALLMAWLASLAGLADIVGAFAGGLLLAETRHAHRIFEELRPLSALFVGFFFVVLGMQVDVTALAGRLGPVLLAGTLLGVLAVGAKLACGWGVVRGQADRLAVGVGMVPRGEVGLIFASLGLASGLLANWQYGLVLIVVLLTTFVTPLWLARIRGRFRPDQHPPVGEGVARALDA